MKVYVNQFTEQPRSAQKRDILKTTTLLAFLMAINLNFTPAAKAENIPAEISAVMLAPTYSQILQEQSALAKQLGKTLRATVYEVMHLDEKTVVQIQLATKFSADFAGQWTDAGSLVAFVSYGPLGEIMIDGLYFKPSADIPGGASVGNN
jgi:citrate lyase gamma subunit